MLKLISAIDERGWPHIFRNRIFPEKKFYEFYDPIRCIGTKDFKTIYNFKPLDNHYQMPVDILNESSG